MIKLKSLLTEDPDTIFVGTDSYRYNDEAGYNRSAFLVYRSYDDNVNKVFGYSLDKKEFFCSDPEVITTLKSMTAETTDPSANTTLKGDVKFTEMTNTGGSHSRLRAIVNEVDVINETLSRARIFRVPDMKEGGYKLIITFWDPSEKSLKFEELWNFAITAAGFDPKAITYEFTDRNYMVTFVDYYTFYGKSKPGEVKPEEPITSDPGTTGDKVAVDASDVVEPAEVNDLEKMLGEKSKEFGIKRGELHSTGAAKSPGEMARLENEVADLEAEIEWLKVAVGICKHVGVGLYIKRDSKYVVDGLRDAIAASMEQRKKDVKKRFDLNAEMEKQFPGMSMAQIRQKFSRAGIPFRKLVKEMVRGMIKEMKSRKKI